MPGFPTGSHPKDLATCPTCDARAEAGQLVCLECGSRVALDYHRPPSWRVPVAIVIAVVLLAVAGAAVALNAIGDDAQRDVSRTPIKTKENKATKGDAKAKPGER